MALKDQLPEGFYKLFASKYREYSVSYTHLDVYKRQPLNGLPPLGIPDVKGVRQDGDRNLAPGLPKQCLLQGPLGLLEPLSVAVGFLALIPVGKPLFLLPQGSGPLPALLDQIIPLVVYLIQGFLQPLLQLLQDLSRQDVYKRQPVSLPGEARRFSSVCPIR